MFLHLYLRYRKVLNELLNYNDNANINTKTLYIIIKNIIKICEYTNKAMNTHNEHTLYNVLYDKRAHAWHSVHIAPLHRECVKYKPNMFLYMFDPSADDIVIAKCVNY